MEPPMATVPLHKPHRDIKVKPNLWSTCLPNSDRCITSVYGNGPARPVVVALRNAADAAMTDHRLGSPCPRCGFALAIVNDHPWRVARRRKRAQHRQTFFYLWQLECSKCDVRYNDESARCTPAPLDPPPEPKPRRGDAADVSPRLTTSGPEC